MARQGAGENRIGARIAGAFEQRGVVAIGALIAMLALVTSLFGAVRADAVPAPVTVTPGQAVYEARGGEDLEFTVSATPSNSGQVYVFELRGIAGQGTVTGLTSTGDATAKGTYKAPNGFTGRAVVSIRATEFQTGARSDGQVIVDVNPKTELTAGPGVGSTPGLTKDSTPSFEFRAVTGPTPSVVGDATFECKVDSGEWVACSSPFTAAVLSEGPHTFSVRASKGTDLTDPTPATTSFTVDTIAPTVSVTSGPSGRVASTSASFGFTNDDPDAEVECRLDSNPWEDCSSPKSYSLLGQGDHTFEVRATDRAGNVSDVASRSWTVDTIASVAIDSGPTDGNTDATPSFAFTPVPDTGLVSECRVYETGQTAPAFAACSSPFTSGPLDKNVSYTFQVKVTDDLGNTDTKTRVWTQSNTAPSLGSPTVTVSAGETAELDLSSGTTDADGDTVGSYTVTSGGQGGIADDGSRITPGTANTTSGAVSVPTSENAAGTYTFSFSASDGREGGTSTNGVATVRVRPDTKDVTEGPTPISDPNPGWSFTSKSGTTDFECQLLDKNDNVVIAWVSCTGGSYAPTVVDGIYKLEVRAKINDLVDPTPLTSGEVEVDTVSPDVEITGPSALLDDADGLSKIASPAFTFVTSDVDPRVFFECRYDSDAPGVWTTCVSGDAGTILLDGDREFRVRAVDAAGNKANVDSFAWERDTTAPVFEITSGPEEGDWTNLRRPTWEYTESDPNPIEDDKNLLPATTTCQIDTGSTVTDCPSPWTAPSFLNDGARKLTLTVQDAAGNTGTEVVNFTVATTSPAAFLEETPDNPSGSSASFEFMSSSELGPNGKFQCRTSANGGSFSLWADCVSPFSLPSLQTGSNTFQVRAVDSAGNAGSGPFVASYTWTVLGTPSVELTATRTGFGNAAFRFVSGDPVATFECQLDSGAWVACTSPRNYSGLAVGSHTFRVRAVNEVATGDPVSHTWNATPPAAPNTEITVRPAVTTTLTAASFEFLSDDPLATFECRIDGGEWTVCDSPKAYEGLATGDHSFEVRAKSPDGRVDATPASWAWNVIDTSIEPVPGQITPSVKGPRSVKSGKSMTLRVVLRNAGGEDAGGTLVCLQGPKSMVIGEAVRCKTIDVAAGSTAGVSFKVKTKAGMSGKRARFRASVEYLAAGEKKKELKGHVTLIK